MRKAEYALPNPLLKQERQLRGWSQKYVAEQIDAATYYISRWERGSTSPSPHFRYKLCILFSKNAKELGLLHEEAGESKHEHTLDFPLLSSLPSPDPQAVLHDPNTPPARCEGLVGRSVLLQEIEQRLCVGKSLVLISFNGLPGVGKTALAVELVHNSQVKKHFCDGILWVGLGPKPNMLGHLSRWGGLLGIDSAEMAKLSNNEAWTRAIRSIIGMRQILLVIDDAWEMEEALAFRVGGPNCAYLVTTRFPEIALHFANNGITTIHELSEEDSLMLLAQLVPEFAMNQLGEVRELVQSVGGLPLALTLMGKYLRTQSYSGQQRRLSTAFARLNCADERLLLTQPQAPGENSPGLPSGIPLSLQAVIAISEQQLSEQGQYALHALSVFPAKPNTFSENAALAICNVSMEALDRLTDAGLLEGSGQDRYTLHRTIADYAKLRFNDKMVEERMAEVFVTYVETYQDDYRILQMEIDNVLTALQIAFDRKCGLCCCGE